MSVFCDEEVLPVSHEGRSREIIVHRPGKLPGSSAADQTGCQGWEPDLCGSLHA